jgi:phage gpG-like protein
VGVIQRDVFGEQTDPFGKPWAPLAESTIEGRRNKKKASIKTLQDTGRMKGLVVARGTATGMVFGSADVEGKANAHLFGTTKAGRGRSVTIPRRAFLPVDKTGRANFGGTGAASEWLARAIERITKWVEKGTL